MFDFKINETGSGGSIEIKGNDIVGLSGFGNMIYLALFGGNYTSTPSRRPSNVQALDYWGNSFLKDPKVQFNSTTERVLSEVALNSDGRLQIEKAVNFDLEFMKPFANVSVSVEIPKLDNVKITVILTQPENPENKDFVFIWDGTRTDNSEFLETELKVSDSFSPAQTVSEPVTVKINGNTLVIVPGGQTLDIELIDTDDVQVGSIIDENTVQVEKVVNPSGVLLRYPTGQQYTSFRTGDEGSRFQNNFYSYSPPSYPKSISRLDHSLGANTFFQLVDNVKVGNVSSKIRFVDVDGGQTWSSTNNKDCITIDKLTGLGFYRKNSDLGSTVTWNNAIDNALTFSVTVDGIVYSDWYLVSFEEIMSLLGELGSGSGSSLQDTITSALFLTFPSSPEFWTATTQSNSGGANAYSKGYNPTTYQRPSGKASSFRPFYVFDARNLISAP